MAKTEEIVFHWSREFGDCDDCALPAAYLSLDAYGPGKHRPLCCVCAAEEAADGGGEITRIDPEMRSGA